MKHPLSRIAAFKFMPGFAVAFSLIELLIVISIISVLTVLAGLSLGGPMKAAKLNSAGNYLADLIAQTRQRATSKNMAVMLVVAKNDDGFYQYFSTYGLPLGAATWVPLSPWEKLPDEIVIDSSKSQLLPPPTSISPPPPTLKRGSQAIPESEYAWQIFLPGGNLLGNRTPVYFLKIRNEDTAASYYQISVIAANGNPIIDRP